MESKLYKITVLTAGGKLQNRRRLTTKFDRRRQTAKFLTEEDYLTEEFSENF